MNRIRTRSTSRKVGLCRFSGCDDDATTTVGVTPLCALHQTLVLNMLDHSAPPGANVELTQSMESWWLEVVQHDYRKLRG